MVKKQIKEKRRARRSIISRIVRFVLGILGSCLLFLALLSTIFFIAPARRAEIIDGLAHRITLGILNEYFYGDISIESAHFDPDDATLLLTDARLKINADDAKEALSASQIRVSFDKQVLRKTPNKFLLALDKVEVQRMVLSAETKHDGSLNIMHLLHPKKMPKPNNPTLICPKVIITDSTLHFTDNFNIYTREKTNETVSDIALTLQLGGNYLPFSLSADINPKTLGNFAKKTLKADKEQTINLIGGIDMKDKNRAEVKIEVNKLNGEDFLSFLPEKLPLDAKISTADIDKATLAVTAEKRYEKWELNLFTEAFLNRVNADITLEGQSISIRDLSTRVIFDGNNLVASDISSRISGIEADGELLLQDIENNGKARLKINCKNINIENLAKTFPVITKDYAPSGIIEKISAEIEVVGEDISAKGRVFGARDLGINLEKGRFSVARAELDFLLANDTLSLTNIVAALTVTDQINRQNAFSENIFTANFSINLKPPQSKTTPRGIFNVKAQNINNFGVKSAIKNVPAVDEFFKEYLSDVTFTASAAIIGNIRGDGSMTLHLDPSGRVNFAKTPELSSHFTSVLSADLAKKTSVSLHSFTLTNPNFSLHATGEIVDGKIAADFETANVDIPKIGSVIPLKNVQEQFSRAEIDGKVYAKGTISGKSDELSFMAALRILEGKYNDISGVTVNANLSGALNAETQSVLVDDLFVSAPNYHTEIALENIELVYGKTPKISVKSVNISPMTIENLASSFGVKDFPVKGFLSSEIICEQSGMDGMSARLTIFNPSIALENEILDFEKLTIDAKFNGTDTLTIKSAILSLGGIRENPTIFASGIVNTEHVELDISSDNLPLRQFLSSDPNEKPGMGADGRFNLPFSVTGIMQLVSHLSLKKNAAGEWKSGFLSGFLNAEKGIQIAEIPYSDFKIDFLSDLETMEVAIADAQISRRDDGKNYAFAITDSKFSWDDIAKNSVTLFLRGENENELADFGDIKDDFQNMLKNTHKIYVFAKNAPQENVQWLSDCERLFASLPPDLDGKLELGAGVTGDIKNGPIIRAVLKGSELIAEGQKLPETLLDVTYDTLSKHITVKDFRLIGGENPDLYIVARENSAIAFPSHENPEGKMDFDVEIQNLDLKYLSAHKALSFLEGYRGVLNISISSDSSSTMTRPGVYSSVDWQKPVVHGLEFDSFSTILELDHDLTANGNHRIYIGQRSLGALGDATLYPLGTLAAGAKPISISGFIPISLGERAEISINDAFSLVLKLPRQQVSTFSAYLDENNPLIDSLKEGYFGGIITLGGTLNKPRFAQNSYINLNIPHISLIDAAAGAVEGVKNIDTVINFTSGTDSGGNIQNRVVINELSAEFEPFKTAPKVSVIDKVKIALGLSKKVETRQARSTFYANGNLTVTTPKEGWIEGDYSNLNSFINYNVALNFVNMPIRFNTMLNGQVNGRLNLINSREPSDNNRPILAGIVAANNMKMTYAALDTAMSETQVPFAPLLSVLLLFNGQNDLNFSLGSKGLFEAVNGYLPINTSHINYDTLLPEELDSIVDELIKIADADDTAQEKANGFLSQVRRSNRENRDISIGIVGGDLQTPMLSIQYSLVPQKANIKLPGGQLTAQEKPAINGTVTYNKKANAENPLNITAYGLARVVIPNYTLSVEIDSDDLINDLLLINTVTPTGDLTAQATPVNPIKISILYAAPGSPTLTEYDFFNRFMGLGNIVNALNHTEGSDAALRAALMNIGISSILGDSVLALADSIYLDNISFAFDPNMNVEVTALTKEWRITDNLAVHLGLSTIFDGNQQVRNWIELGVPQKSEEELEKMGKLKWLKDLSIVGEYSSYDDFNNSSAKFKTNLSLQYRWRFTLGNWNIN